MAMPVEAISLPMPMGLGAVNCYLLRVVQGFVLIDTGPSIARARLRAELAERGCRPGSLPLIVLTHGDFDHTGNAAALRMDFGSALAMHPDDAGMAEQGDMFSNRRRPNAFVRAVVPALSGFGGKERFAPSFFLSDGDSLADFGVNAIILSLPGHSRGSVAVLCDDGSLFCGDLLENVKRPAPGSIVDDSVAAAASIERLRGMPVGIVYPGHGRPFRFSELG